MKKILKTIISAMAVIISLSVIYTMGFRTVFYILNNRADQNENQSILSHAGKGLTWISKSNKKTLFFIPSSQEIAAEELYGSWLKEIHEEYNVNIIIPPFDTEGLIPYIWGENSSVVRRSESVDFLYKLYSEQMGADHDITLLSTGDGSIQALELAGKYTSMEKVILISPVQGTMERRAGTVFHKLIGLPILPYVIPWLPEYYSKNRVGPYDILNDNLNEQFHLQYGKYIPSYINLEYMRKLNIAAEKLMTNLNAVLPGRFFIIYADDDLSYGLEGFERMGDELTRGGSEVSIMRVPQSGRLILFDNDRDRIIELISILLQ